MNESLSYIELAGYGALIFIYLKISVLRRVTKIVENYFDKLDGKYFSAICFIIVSAFSYVFILEGHNFGDDFSQYAAQSRAILNGDIPNWLEKQTFIIEHSTPGYAPLIYPWVTAVLILPLYKIFGLNFYAFKWLEAFLLAGTWSIFYYFLRLRFGKAISSALTAVMLFNICYLSFVDNVVSEMPYMLFSLMTIFFVYKRKLSDEKILYGVLIGFALFISIHTKSICWALLIALIGDDLFYLAEIFKEKLSIRLIRFLPYATFLCLYAVCSNIFPYLSIKNNAGYMSIFSLNVEDFLNQTFTYFALFGDIFMPYNPFYGAYFPRDNLPCIIIATILIGSMLIGMIKNFTSDRYLIFYFFVTMAVLCAFNVFGGIRYIFGVVPVAIYFAFLGINYLVEKFQAYKLGGGIIFSVVIATIIFSLKCTADFQTLNKNFYQAYSNEAVDTYDFINKNIPENKVVYFFRPRDLYFNTNVYSYALLESSEENLNSADYVLLTIDDDFDELKKITADSPKYEKIYGNEKFSLYKIN